MCLYMHYTQMGEQMKKFLKMFRSEQRGLSLLEMTVVAAIISILVALTAVAVTGTTSRPVP